MVNYIFALYCIKNIFESNAPVVENTNPYLSQCHCKRKDLSRGGRCHCCWGHRWGQGQRCACPARVLFTSGERTNNWGQQRKEKRSNVNEKCWQVGVRVKMKGRKKYVLPSENNVTLGCRKKGKRAKKSVLNMWYVWGKACIYLKNFPK